MRESTLATSMNLQYAKYKHVFSVMESYRVAPNARYPGIPVMVIRQAGHLFSRALSIKTGY
jgi:hypothetical protein